MSTRPSHPRSTTLLSSLTDDALVTRVRCGDDDAFAEVFRRYRAPLRSFAGRILAGTSQDADDIVQDAFIRAHRGLRVTNRPMALRPWLYMIVRNQAIDVLRALRTPGSLGDDEWQLEAVNCDPADRMAERDEVRELVAQIGRLPERQRMALVMREFDGRSHEETARLLHTTVPATKSLIIRARSRLEATLHAA
jgi:RNA polymerase sigma factor (sigma-70 family)